MLDNDAKFESNEVCLYAFSSGSWVTIGFQRRLLLGWTTPIGWFRVRISNALQFWGVQLRLAYAKKDSCQSNQIVRTQLYALEESLCNYTDDILAKPGVGHGINNHFLLVLGLSCATSVLLVVCSVMVYN